MARRRAGSGRVLALPGTLWNLLLFAVPFYGVLALAGGHDDLLFGRRVPEWNPRHWNDDAFREVWNGFTGGVYGTPFLRTCVYVALAMIGCCVIGGPVAYYVARHAHGRRGLLLGLLLAPFWVSYLMRMLAWVNLLQDDGWVNALLRSLHLGTNGVSWLDARWYTIVIGLVYGYVPYFILPMFVAFDRVDQRLLEASRDLGVGPVRTFWHVTVPVARQGIVAALAITALPMFGDYYTNTLLSSSPRTNMIGNQIQTAVRGTATRGIGAALVLALTIFLLVLFGWAQRSAMQDAP